jgi:hypothetical protein
VFVFIIQSIHFFLLVPNDDNITQLTLILREAENIPIMRLMGQEERERERERERGEERRGEK